MRCNDCGKFVSFEEPTVELQEEGITSDDDGGVVDVGVHIVLSCAECGVELKEYNDTLSITFEHKCEKKDVPDGDVEYEIELDEAEVSDDYRPKTKTTKAGIQKSVPMRYQKHIYIVDVNGRATCSLCACPALASLGVRRSRQLKGLKATGGVI